MTATAEGEQTPALASDASFLVGLKSLAAVSSPKNYTNCGWVFPDGESYARMTAKQFAGRRGFKQGRDHWGEVIVELFRNCSCGSALMDSFSDRRNFSPDGMLRCQRFEGLTDTLASWGISHEVARQELLKVMRGGSSHLIRPSKPTTAPRD